MRKIVFTILLIVGNFVQAQNKKQIDIFLKSISSTKDIEEYKSINPSWEVDYIELSDTLSDLSKKIKNLKENETTRLKINGEKFQYKLLNKRNEIRYRASYIFLDGKKLNQEEIDSLRNLILFEYNSGFSFKELVKNYNMDFNPNNGDLGWFEPGIMVPEFENSIKAHKKNDIFLVNVDSRKWYYVVLKTYQDLNYKILELVRVKEL